MNGEGKKIAAFIEHKDFSSNLIRMNNNQELGIQLTSTWHGLLEVMDSSVSTQNLVTELPHYFSFPNWENGWQALRI